MRVLHVFPVHEVGGGENVMLNLIRFRQHPGIEHSAVILSSTGGDLAARLGELGVPWRTVPRGRMRRPFALAGALRGLRASLHDVRPDWVLANSPQAFLYARLASIGTETRVALYYMTVPDTRLLRNGPLDILMAVARPAVTFTASHRIAATLHAWGLPAVEAVHHGTVPPSVDHAQRHERDALLAALGVPAAAPLIVFPGRLQRWKGQHVLVTCMPAILAAVHDAHAILLGGALFGQSSDYPGALATQIGTLGLERRVHLVGHQPVGAWLERAHVVVHASTTPDPFPNVCLEALACGRPLVTNTLSGICEIVEDRLHAIVVQPGDPADLARGVIEILQDPALAARIADAGHAQYLRAGTAALMVRRIERTLASATAARGLAVPA